MPIVTMEDIRRDTDVSAKLSKGVEAGVALATAQDQINLKKQQVEAQRFDIDQAKFNGALGLIKTYSNMSPEVRKLARKQVVDRASGYMGAPAESLVNMLDQDESFRNKMSIVANSISSNPKIAQQLGISTNPAQAMMDLQNLAADPLNGPGQLDSIYQTVVKLSSEDARLAQQESIADKRILGSQVNAATRADASAEKADKSEKRAAAKATSDLRKEYTGSPLYKEMGELAKSYSKVESFDPNTKGAGQQALVFAFSKMLDPGSVVRETEYAQSAANAGAISRAQQYLTQLQNGEMLTADQIKQMKEVAKGLYSSGQAGLESTKQEYTRLAEESGLDPSRVIVDPFKKGTTPAAQGTGQAPVTANPPAGAPQAPAVALESQYKKLAAGGKYTPAQLAQWRLAKGLAPAGGQ